MAFLTVIGIVFIVAFIANIRQDFHQKKYDEYLIENGWAVATVEVEAEDQLAYQRWADDGGNR